MRHPDSHSPRASERRCGWRSARDFIRRLQQGSDPHVSDITSEEQACGQVDAPPAEAGDEHAFERLPAPQEHIPPGELVDREMPTMLFGTLDHGYVDLRALAARCLVLYVFPGCGEPGSTEAETERRRHRAFAALRSGFAAAMPSGEIVALTSLSPLEQFRRNSEIIWRCSDEQAACPHHLVSDDTWQAAQELGLPTFELDGRTFYEPVTIIACGLRIRKVFHPAEAGRDAHQALTWLRAH